MELRGHLESSPRIVLGLGIVLFAVVTIVHAISAFADCSSDGVAPGKLDINTGLPKHDSLGQMLCFRNKQPAAVAYKGHSNHNSRPNRSYNTGKGWSHTIW